MRGDYYDDLRFCESCRNYVRYLQSPDKSYCVNCGDAVKIFSREDCKAFSETKRRHWNGLPAASAEDSSDWDGFDPRLIS